MTKQVRDVPPDTKRIVEGLRDTGYTFDAAIADIVDNSIAANADHVSIFVGKDGDDRPLVTIADDGEGMSLAGLENAMRYGSEERSTRNSLGRFGLGLKTASTGFCRRLTLVSKPAGAKVAQGATWDLDELARVGTWSLEIGTLSSDEQAMFDDGIRELAALGSKKPSGTLVWWSKVDKLLKTKGGTEAKNQNLALDKTVRQLRDHLAMVFQRFLDPDDTRGRNVVIAVNEVPVDAWDPFCSLTGGDKVLDKSLKVQSADGAIEVATLRAFILPRKEEFQSDEARDNARLSIERQGIYLYREERMIEGPNWLGTGSTETHINNLRVELSFPAQLDEIFGVGIKKSGVHLDPNLTDQIRALLAPARREADTRSRKGNTSAAAKKGGDQKRPSELTISRIKKSLTVATVESGDGESLAVVNNTGTVSVLDESGKPSGIVTIVADDETAEMNVVTDETLEDGVLWEARLHTSNVIQAHLNAGHEWYRKAYLPNVANSPLVQSIEYLFYALAQAEMNNTSKELDEIFHEFKVEVSRNLKKLVKDLPEPDDD